MKVNWVNSEQHPKTIACIRYRDGILARIEFNITKEYWEISLFNGLIELTRDRGINQIDEVKTIVEGMLWSGTREIQSILE